MAVKEVDTKTGENVLKYRLGVPIPYMLRGVLTDTVVNLRSALDHCGFAFSGLPDDKTSKTNFPFCHSASELPGRKTGMSAEIPPAIFAVMASFQPYPSGNALLWALNEIANTHKHRIIKPFGSLNVATQLDGTIRTRQHPAVLTMKWDGEKNEIEVLRVAKGGSVRLNIQMQITTAIVFDKIPVVEGKKVSATLETQCGIVSDVINAVEAKARETGLLT